MGTDKFELPADHDSHVAILVDGGIASLSAARFVFRNGARLGRNITALEASSVIGGSLDGSGSPTAGDVLRGGRDVGVLTKAFRTLHRAQA